MQSCILKDKQKTEKKKSIEGGEKQTDFEKGRSEDNKISSAQ